MFVPEISISLMYCFSFCKASSGVLGVCFISVRAKLFCELGFAELVFIAKTLVAVATSIHKVNDSWYMNLREFKTPFPNLLFHA